MLQCLKILKKQGRRGVSLNELEREKEWIRWELLIETRTEGSFGVDKLKINLSLSV